MKNEILTVSDQLVAAAANGVYQGVIVAILVALGLRWVGRTNAATRHAIWFSTLLLLVALVVAHCLVDSFSPQPVPADAQVPLSSAALATPSTDPVLPEAKLPLEKSSRESADFRDTGSVELEEQSNSETHPLLVALIQAQHDSIGNVVEQAQPHGIEPDEWESNNAGLASSLSDGATGFRWPAERLLNPIPVKLTLGSTFPRFASLILLALWLTIAGFRVVALMAQLVRIHRLKHQSLPPGAELNALFRKCTARLATDRKVELRVSPAHRSSFLLGFLHPVVLLPATEPMEPAEAELVLRHELAHLERRDDWVNLFQHLLLAIFFFHPAFWWISRQLTLAREIACDDHVLHQSKRPQAYALVLANLAARMQRRLPLLAPGSSNHKTQLKERIDMILNTHRNASPRLAKSWLALITSLAALVAVAVIGSAPRIVLAQIDEPAAIAPPAEVFPDPAVDVVVPVALVSGTPHPASAELAPPGPLPPAVVGAGPRFKPGPIAVSIPPIVTTAPTISLAPMTTRLSVTVPAPGQPISLAAVGPAPAPRPANAPRPVKPPRPADRDSALEERLERLERMVESLVNQPNPKGRADLQLRIDKDGMIDRKEMARIEALAKQQQAELWRRISPQEVEKIKEQAERDAKRAVEQAMRATVEAEKAHQADQKQAARKVKADSQRQLEALQKQVEALERQREKLEHEIERLEQDQEELDEQDEDSHDSHAHHSESKAECATESATTSTTR